LNDREKQGKNWYGKNRVITLKQGKTGCMVVLLHKNRHVLREVNVMACNCVTRWRGTRLFPAIVEANKVAYTWVADQVIDCRTDLSSDRQWGISPYGEQGNIVLSSGREESTGFSFGMRVKKIMF
jgi:hypothetical protein